MAAVAEQCTNPSETRPQSLLASTKVDSAIVSIWRDDRLAARIEDRAFFLDFVRRLFHHRRKLVRSVLVGMFRKQLEKPQIDALLAELGMTEELRAEQMDTEQLIRLSNRFVQALGSSREILDDSEQ